MHKNIKYGISMLVVIIVLALSGVTVKKSMSKEDMVDSAVLKEDNKDELKRYIASLQRYPTQTLQLIEDGENQYYQAVKKYDLNEYVLSDPGTETIYPGAILRGDSLFQEVEKYTPISAARTPMYLTSSGKGGQSMLVEDVSYRTVSKALNDMQESKEKEAAQEWTYYIHTFNKLYELEYSLGADVVKQVKMNMSVDYNYENSLVAVVYKQIYYTVNAESLHEATDYFKEGTNISDFGIYEPVYVSSVDYGRTFIVFIYGEKSSIELEEEVSACLDGVGITQGLSNIVQLTDLDHYMYQVGGKSDNIDQIWGKSERKKGIAEQWDEFWNGSDEEQNVERRINEYLDIGGDLINPIPLSYKLRYLSDNSPVPSVIVEKKSNQIPAQDARLVKISLSGNLEGRLQLNVPEVSGFLLSENWTEITKKGETTEEIVILWDSANTNLIEGTFEKEDIEINLANCPQSGKVTQLLKNNKGVLGIGKKETYVNINISDMINEIK